MDRDAIEYHIHGLLKAIGENPDREGLKETPARVARMIEEVLEGQQYTNHKKSLKPIQTASGTFPTDRIHQTRSAVSM